MSTEIRTWLPKAKPFDLIIAPYNAYHKELANITLTGVGDIAAIMAAQDRIYAARGGGTIAFLPGDIMAEQTWVINKPVDIFGGSKGAWSAPPPEAKNATRVNPIPWGVAAFHVLTVDPLYNLNDLTIAGLCVEAGGVAPGNYDGINIPHTHDVFNQLTFDHVNVASARRHGFNFSPGAMATYHLMKTILHECEARDNVAGAGYYFGCAAGPMDNIDMYTCIAGNNRYGLQGTGDIRGLKVFGGNWGANRETIYLENVSGYRSGINFFAPDITETMLVGEDDTYPVIYLNNCRAVKFWGLGQTLGGTPYRRYGVRMVDSDYCEFHAVNWGPGNRGAYSLEGCQHNLINGGVLLNVCNRKAENTYDAIAMLASATPRQSIRNKILGVSIIDNGGGGALARRCRYGVSEADVNQDYNIVANNQIVAGVTAQTLRSGVNSDFSHNV